MKSTFIGNAPCGTKHHMVHYFDGQRLREVCVSTLNGTIYFTERTVAGVFEEGDNYRNALRRLARYERRCSSRVGYRIW